ncbi:N-formylglutamate amidohydrolase [Rhodococcus sp. IEGM 1307]|uniref:N-formylglutamate amidohydrolase n=1 Tax=Rhodococcus sp. IEGM 1307 TaxID=3047091 RepID=UPI0024B8748D|nr:N-formylglutamate amidohydrolase [Rhodococcus sp. IEGM 1307]MDI9979356.1 N-formylglutamate amidohydrolase [Rhodococcus sp. IEGM 1307]
MNSFSILRGHPTSPVILHVPHASRKIPPHLRAQLLIDDAALDAELDEATDTDTDLIATLGADHARTHPWIVNNALSRLIIDPERFPDASEPAAAYGRGAVYTRACDGRPLRDEPFADTETLLDEYFHPYARAVAELVTDRIAACGQAVIIDVHSYPKRPSGFENPSVMRPALCIGTDPLHTPDWLTSTTRQVFRPLGEIAENTPYAGCYVPLDRYGHDKRVSAVMIELRRDTYLPDDGRPGKLSVTQLGEYLAELIDTATEVGTDV